jgi:hypothetical protein
MKDETIMQDEAADHDQELCNCESCDNWRLARDSHDAPAYDPDRWRRQVMQAHARIVDFVQRGRAAQADVDKLLSLHRKKRQPEAEHIGMDGKPCQCGGPSARYRERKRGGCAPTCFCHGVKHARCPLAKPCLGDCGRLTTSGESPACGYCLHCSSDRRWVPL